jgi:hypothetical protein
VNNSAFKVRLVSKIPLLSWLKLLAVSISFSVLAACSESPGGGGIGGSGKIDPVVNSGLLIGQVTAIDNLTVDGVQLSTDQTNVVINGDSGELEDVRVGMAVTVDVDNDNLQAEKIEYRALVAGPVEIASADGDTVTILGQKVLISDTTVLDQLTTEDIFAGEVLEISGMRDENNAIAASFVRPYLLWENYFLTGQLEVIQSEPLEYSISGTTVDFSAYLDSVNQQSLPQKLIGTTVVVEMQIRTPLAEELVASTVTSIPERNAEDYETVSVAGNASDITETGSFTVQSFTFQINDETVFLDSLRNSIERVAITTGLKVSVSGLTLTGDSLLATEIVILQPD